MWLAQYVRIRLKRPPIQRMVNKLSSVKVYGTRGSIAAALVCPSQLSKSSLPLQISSCVLIATFSTMLNLSQPSKLQSVLSKKKYPQWLALLPPLPPQLLPLSPLLWPMLMLSSQLLIRLIQVTTLQRSLMLWSLVLMNLLVELPDTLVSRVTLTKFLSHFRHRSVYWPSLYQGSLSFG